MTAHDESKLTHQEYLDERQLLYGNQQSNYVNFEKTILTLGSALLAFSIAFLRLLPPDTGIEAKSYLIASWVCFGAAIVSILLSFVVSGIAFNSEIKAIETAR